MVKTIEENNNHMLQKIPEDWEIKRLEEIAEVKGGKRIPKGWKLQEQPNGYPYITVADMNKGSIDLSNIRYVPKQIQKSINKYRIFSEDIYISVAGTLGLIGVVPKTLDGANLTENANRITKISCDRDYLKYYLMSEIIQKKIKNTSTVGAQPKLALTRIEQFEIALPKNISEQKMIATALKDVDKLIESLEKIIDKKKKVKQGTMQQLLTGRKRLPGFTEEWIYDTVENFAETGRGRVISHNEINKSIMKKYPVYSSQTTNNGIMGYLDTYDFNGEYITWTTDGANAGKVFYRKGKFNCTNVCGTLKLKKYDYKFIARVLDITTDKYVARNLANPKLMNDVMKKIKIFIPSNIEEQRAIATVLSDMDAEIEVLEKKLKKYETIKEGMMQQLLSGRVRLV